MNFLEFFFSQRIFRFLRAFTIHSFFVILVVGCSNSSSNKYPEIEVELKQSTVSLTEKSPIGSAANNQENEPPKNLELEDQEAQRLAKIIEVTLPVDSILNRPFLYGSALQESSVFETPGEAPVDVPAINLGLFPAKFEVFGDKLRLVTESSHEFESDINRPGRLIHEFLILKKSKNSITFQVTDSSPILHTFFLGKETTSSVRVSWLRDFRFFKDDQLFFFESAVELSDGSVGFFAESIQPREKVVPEDAKPMYVDEDLNPGTERFRFLDGGYIYTNVDGERVQTKTAQRYFKNPGKPIEWWVTANVPKEYLNDVKNGIEAWNRYSESLGGEKIVEFKGILPAEVKVGDPRYNIVVWDNISEADAAYESQSSDPLTGIQSNSLIYLPLAWVNIGKDYWKNVGKSSGEKNQNDLSAFLSKRTVLGKKAPLRCMHPIKNQVSLASLSDEDFGRKLLKSVLFHEMGHALGLAHNFKGSLSFDLDQAESPFSTTIMDYNQYNEESKAFYELEGADGPLLEYDRQILSYLYNEGKSIRDSDPVLPACSDEEADSKEGGVDPLCVRYDIGKDPTSTAEKTLNLLKSKDAVKGMMKSLPLTLGELSKHLPEAQSIEDEEKLRSGLEDLTKLVEGVVGIYISNEANSLGIAISDAILSLYAERDLLPGYKIEEMRSRTIAVLNEVEAMSSLPPATQLGYETLKLAALDWAKSTAVMKTKEKEPAEKLLNELTETLQSRWEQIQTKHILKLKSRIASSLTYSSEAPFSFHSENGSNVDLEKYAVSKLENLFLNTKGNWKSVLDLRMRSLKTLSKFPEESRFDSFSKIRAQVEEEIRKSVDARERESLRKLLETLK